MRNIAATALLTSLVLALVGLSLAVSEHAETRARLDQRLALQADGEANALGGLFARTSLALRLVAGDTGLRESLGASTATASPAIERALGALEHAEPGLVGAASAIGLDGRERGRVVRGTAVPASALARDVRAERFFRATLGTRPGGIYLSAPYRSADTGVRVVSASALVRTGDGAPLGIVRFELALLVVRATATAALGDERGVQIAIVDSATGLDVLDSRGALAGASGSELYREVAAAADGQGAVSSGGRRLAYRALTGVPAGLGWIVVAAGPQPSPFAAAGISAGVLALLAVAVALAAAGAIALRQQRRGAEQALLAAEGGRAEAEQRSRSDALTDLYNRRHVLESIAAEFARSDRSGVPPSVLLLDLDHFKRINDVYGDAVGDRVLAELARRLQGRLRGYDVLGRWGGDEFIVLAPGVPDDATLGRLARQLRRLVGSLPIVIGDDTLLPVTVSVGAARAGDALRSVEGLVDCADRALAAAKRRGRDRVQLFADLTVEDLVAEEPEPIRLARALTLSSSARAGIPHADAERVSDLAVGIAEELGLDHGVAARCRLGGLLHDIGTVSVSDRILALTGPPVARDRIEYETHVGAGERLVRSVAGVSEAAEIVGAHEERYDGSGYPAGLSGQGIPLEARIVATAIAYAQLARALPGAGAAPALERLAGSALDPEIVAAALTLLARERGIAARNLGDVPAA